MNVPKLSVIVPVYNVELYLPLCMDSLLNQTLKEIEIILVDDQSPDNCPKLCDEYAKQDSRIKVIHKKNEGLGYARNTGLDIARGEYVTFIDSDDYIDTCAYDTLYSLAKMHDLDILRFNYNRFRTEGTFMQDNSTKEFSIYTEPWEIRQIALCLFSIPLNEGLAYLNLGGSACTAIYKRKLLFENSIRFHSERELISEDYIFVYDCLQRTRRIGKIDCSFYHYRKNPSSLTTYVCMDKMRKVEEYCKYVTKKIINDGYSLKDAQLYPMGYYLKVLRAQVNVIFGSSLPIKLKRKWFLTLMSNQYIQYIYKIYPVKIMLKRHRLHCFMVQHKYFWCMYMLVHLLKIMRMSSRILIFCFKKLDK